MNAIEFILKEHRKIRKSFAVDIDELKVIGKKLQAFRKKHK